MFALKPFSVPALFDNMYVCKLFVWKHGNGFRGNVSLSQEMGH